MTKLIKIYGERHTNTNYLSKLIELNLHAQEIPGVIPPSVAKIQKKFPGNEFIRDLYFLLTYRKNLGWKHTLVKPHKMPINRSLTFITITKNPYSWLLSLYRKPYHQYFKSKPTFEDFLNTPWKTVGRENTQNKFLANPIELWNLKNKAYLQLSSAQTINLTSESLFEDAGKVIDSISNQFSIEKKSDKFINYEKSTKDKKKNGAYYRDYYLSEKWRDQLSPTAIITINNSIDKVLMSHFGYNLLT